MKNLKVEGLSNCIYIGDSFYVDLKKILIERKLVGTDIILITGLSSFVKSAFNRQLEELLSELEITITYRLSVSSNPSRTDIDQTVLDLRDVSSSHIMAVGGGSVIDYAKACKLYSDRGYDMLCVYTNPGSGAIASPFTIYDNHEFKIGDHSERILPEVVYVNCDMVASVPARVEGSGVSDIYCHAVEAYLSKVSTDVSRRQALDGIKYLQQYLQDRDAETLLLADIFSILSESVGIVLIPHALGHVITYQHGVRHGHASILFMRSYLQHLDSKGIIVPDNFITVFDTIFDMYAIQAPRNLPPNISEQSLDLVEKYMNFTIENSPVEITREDVRRMYAESVKLVIS